MTTSGRTIAKNASILMVSQLITWGLTFMLMIFMPRYLGPEGLGQIQLAGSLWTILAVIAALGTDTLVTKDIARWPGRLNEMVSTALALRALIFMLGSIGMAVYVWLANYPDLTVLVIWIVGYASLFGQLTGTYDAALKGLERMEYTSLAAVASGVVLSFLRIGLLLLGFGVIPIAAVGVIANVANLVILVYFLQKHYSFKLSVNWRMIRSMLQVSLPYFLVSVGIVLYHQMDTVIISLLADEGTVGWYGAVDRLFGTLLFIPNVFVTALFPALNRVYAGSLVTTRKLAQKSLNLLVLMSVPIGLGISVIANQLVVLLFGPNFTNSGPVLAIRGIFIILTYVNMLLGFLLISMDRQKAWAAVMLISAFATIPLDLILVPWTMETFANGALGGALSYVFTEIGMVVTGFALLPRGTFSQDNSVSIVKMIFAGCVMAALTWVVRDAFIVVPVAVGGMTYAGMILVLRVIPKDDWDLYLGLGASFFQRIRGRFARPAELRG